MRITESRLRRIIRQVIREGFEDYDATDASSRARNKRIEKQHRGSYTDRMMAKHGIDPSLTNVKDVLRICRQNKEMLLSCEIDPNLFLGDSYDARNYSDQDIPSAACHNIAEDISVCLGLGNWSGMSDKQQDAIADAVLYALQHADSVHGLHSCTNVDFHGYDEYVVTLVDQSRLVKYLCHPGTESMAIDL